MRNSSRILRTDWLIDRIADRFEAAHGSGESPRLEEYLSEAPAECRPALLRELLTVELQVRRERGEQPHPEEYRRRFPDREDEIRTAFQMADDTTDDGGPQMDDAEPTLAILSMPQPCASRITAGARYGRFELLEILGSGGFGMVWKAYDTVLKRMVALKMPQGCPRDAALLLEEARHVARLKHAAIAQVYDAGQVDGIAYIASEYIVGRSLRELLANEKISCRGAAAICVRAAEALHHAHEMGIVHRDIKPGNILLDAAGAPYLTDFGLAKTEGMETPEGRVVGTARYMSPEQAAGTGGQIDRRSDVYSLGVVLYEMLVGRRPFESEGDALLQQIQEAEPIRPRILNRGIPRDLEAVCWKCLRKKPADRYGNAGELASDLERFLQGEPVSARPLSFPRRLARWARRQPAIAALTFSCLLLLAGVITVGTVSYIRTARALDTAESNLYSHRVIAADHAWHANNMSQFDRLLEQCPPRLRGWEWGYLSGLRSSAHLVLDDAGGPVDFSPDGSLIATGGGTTCNVKLWDAASGEMFAELVTHTGHVSSVDFSADGRLLLSAGGEDNTAILWDVAARQKMGVFRGHTGSIHSARLLPGAERVVTVSADGSLRVWDTHSQQELFRCDHGALHVRSMSLSPDGRLVAVSTGKNRTAKVRVWDLETRQLAWSVPAFNRAVGLAFSPDGSTLAAAGGRDLLRMWDVTSQALSREISVIPIAAPCVSFTPDGEQFAFTHWDNSVVMCDAKLGRHTLVLRGHTGRVQQIAFSSDGQFVALGTNTNRVYVHRTSTAQGMTTLRGHQGRIGELAFVPGSRKLVSGGYDGTVRVWDLAAQRQLQVLMQQASPVHSVSCSPDGATIAAITEDGVVRTWDAKSGEPLLEFHDQEGFVHDLAYSPSGDLLASVNGQSTVALRVAATGDTLQLLVSSCGPIHRVAFSPCGRWLAIGTRDRHVEVYDTETWTPQRRISLDSPVAGLALSKDSVVAAVDNDGSVYAWDIESGEMLWGTAARGARRRAALAFHPDGSRLVIAIHGEAVTLWEIAQRQEYLRLVENADVAGLVTFSSGGTDIASATANGAIRVWSSTN